MRDDVTILVNSTDSFQDCWNPFFKLFSHYWPQCELQILLNTETRNFSFPGLRIKPTRNSRGSKRRLKWGEATRRALDFVDTKLVLYLQEDYFLNDFVQGERLEYFCTAIEERDLDVIRLMECGNSGPWRPSDDPLLWEVDPRSRYLVSLQAGLWKTDSLRSLIRTHETPWQMEIWGSSRARRRGTSVYCVNRDHFGNREPHVFPYVPTGVVKGKWNRAVVEDLFESHSITCDFSVRGFVDERSNLGRQDASPWHTALRRSRQLLARIRSF